MQKEVSTNKKWASRLAVIIFVLVVFHFMVQSIVANWEKVSTYQFSLHIPYLVLSLVFVIAGVIGQALVWRMLVHTLQKSVRLSPSDGIGIFTATWLTRYIPGTVLVFISRVVLAAQKGIARRYTAVSLLLEALFSIAGSSVVAALFLLVSGGAGEQYLAVLLLAIVAGIILTHPRILYPAANTILKVTKQKRIEKTHQFSLQRNIQFILLYTSLAVLTGVGFFFFISSIVPDVPFSLLHIIGVYNLAAVMGVLAFFVPAGLGVREAMLILLLQLFIPLPMAVIVAFAARLWSVAADFLLIGFVAIFIRYRPYVYSTSD